MKHPFDHSMDEIFPVDIDAFPESMRASIVAIRRSTKRRRIIGRVIGGAYYFSLACLVVIVALAFAQATDRAVPIRSDVAIITPWVRAGQDLTMRVTPYRYRFCETKVAFVIYDGQDRMTTIEMDWQQPKGPIGPDKPFLRMIKLPVDSTPGDAILRIQRQFRCPYNFFHQRWPIVEMSPDMAFKILPEFGR